MEASQAVEGQEQGTEQEPQGQEQQEAQAPDYTPIIEHLDRIGEGLHSTLEERIAALSPQEPQEPDPADELQPLIDSDDPDPQQARAILDRMMERKADEKYGPIAQEVAELRMERAADQLFAELPELKDEKVLEKAYGDAYDWALEMTRDPEQAEWLANQPKMIRAAHLAGAASQRAADEQSASTSEGEVELESAGGARPGTAEDDDDQLRRAIRESGGNTNTFLTG